MVFLVLTRAGFDELKGGLGRVPSPLWVAQGVLSDAEKLQLDQAGIALTCLSVDLADPHAIEDAMEAIRQKHAGERVWVEHVAIAGERNWMTVLQALVGQADAAFDRAWLQVRQAARQENRLTILPYMGYATADRIVATGRVLQEGGLTSLPKAGTGWQNLIAMVKLMASNEVPGARLCARIGDASQEVIADQEGYFKVDMAAAPPTRAAAWPRLELELLDAPLSFKRPVGAVAEVLSVPGSARFGVISDIDDTVVWTNAVNKLNMLMMLGRSNPHTRKPFKGVAAFYKALRDGRAGAEGNPLFYVSSSPWNLYPHLLEFMRVQGIPKGPLFLKDFGDHTLFAARDHHSHKMASIEQLLQAFPHLSFVLIGDSGEQDPEIYSRVARLNPGRVRVIYIRSVNADPGRIEAIDRLIEECRRTGVELVLAADSEFAANHAAALGLISPVALERVREDKHEGEGE